MEKNSLINSMESLGVNLSPILLPRETVKMEKWAVIACDQYTSEIEYWKDIEDLVGCEPSTLHLIYPEAYLEQENEADRLKRIKDINACMESYIESNILFDLNAFVLVERTFPSGLKRHGLVLSVDLEHYDFSPRSSSLIRATEGTIVDRLLPRIKIRENACLEASHIMLLIDDINQTVIEPLFQDPDRFSSLYDFDLMKAGGKIKGWKIDDEEVLKDIVSALSQLADIDTFRSKYDLDNIDDVLLFAVGDGNHSLATAKVIWEEVKKNLSLDEQKDHPSRYALVEVVNLHDRGLQFEPIHRVLFNVDSSSLLESFSSYYDELGCPVSILSDATGITNDGDNHVIKFVSPTNEGYILIKNPKHQLAVGSLQSFLDNYLENNPEAYLDYVHGDESTLALGKKNKNMAFFLDKLDKNELFKTVILDGALPRKTFSMGHASEKRFYLELRKIR